MDSKLSANVYFIKDLKLPYSYLPCFCICKLIPTLWRVIVENYRMSVAKQIGHLLTITQSKTQVSLLLPSTSKCLSLNQLFLRTQSTLGTHTYSHAPHKWSIATTWETEWQQNKHSHTEEWQNRKLASQKSNWKASSLVSPKTQKNLLKHSHKNSPRLLNISECLFHQSFPKLNNWPFRIHFKIKNCPFYLKQRPLKLDMI